MKRNREEECNIKKSYLEALKTKLDKFINSSSMLVIKIDGLYQCERDDSIVCDNLWTHLHPNISPNVVIPCEDN